MHSLYMIRELYINNLLIHVISESIVHILSSFTYFLPYFWVLRWGVDFSSRDDLGCLKGTQEETRK